MKFYVAFDDTDTLDCGRGTGKLARWYAESLPGHCKVWGVVRQQLLHHPSVPMTSHNSSLCVVLETPFASDRGMLTQKAIAHIQANFFEGSDPGLCVASADDPGMDQMIEFGIKCTHTKVSQAEAFEAAKHVHLSGHGGTNDGVIGAVAAVGLTHLGESGRLVSYRDIRDLPQIVTAGELRQRAITPISVNRHAEYIPDNHTIDTCGSLRPHLSGKRLIIPVLSTGADSWEIIRIKKTESCNPGLNQNEMLGND